MDLQLNDINIELLNLNRNWVHSPKLASSLLFAMKVSLRSKHQAPKRKAFVRRDAPSRFARDRRSRQLLTRRSSKNEDDCPGDSSFIEQRFCFPDRREFDVLEVLAPTLKE